MLFDTSASMRRAGILVQERAMGRSLTIADTSDHILRGSDVTVVDRVNSNSASGSWRGEALATL